MAPSPRPRRSATRSRRSSTRSRPRAPAATRPSSAASARRSATHSAASTRSRPAGTPTRPAPPWTRPEVAQARQHLMAVDYQLRDLGPQVASAYRMAADHAAAETVPAVPHPADPSTSSTVPGQFGSMAEMLAARDQQGTTSAPAADPRPRLRGHDTRRRAWRGGVEPGPGRATRARAPAADRRRRRAAAPVHRRRRDAAAHRRGPAGAGGAGQRPLERGLLCDPLRALPRRAGHARGAVSPDLAHDGRAGRAAHPGPGAARRDASTLDARATRRPRRPAASQAASPAPLMPTLERPTIGRDPAPTTADRAPDAAAESAKPAGVPGRRYRGARPARHRRGRRAVPVQGRR